MGNKGAVILIGLLAVLLVVALGTMGLMGYGWSGMMGGNTPGAMMGGYGMMGRYNMMGGYGFSPLGMLIPLGFWALLIGGVVLLVVRLARDAGRAPTGGGPTIATAFDILNLRFARGEITKEQFDEMKQTLGTS